MTHQFQIRLQRVAYLIIFVFIVVFLWLQGAEPWQAAMARWQVMLGVMAVAPLALMVQAAAYRHCIPPNVPAPSLTRMIRIWAIASITSYIAPLVAGLAVRTTLLKQEGIDIRTSSIATLRQTWINIDYAWITASLLLVLYPWPQYPLVGYGLAGAWLILKLLRKHGPRSRLLKHPNVARLLERWPKQSLRAQPLLWGQIFIMGFNYWLAFNLGGASLSWHMSLLLASATILASLVIFIPQGIGVLDALWVWIASQQGLSLPEGVALALTMRFGFLFGAGLVWSLLSLRAIHFKTPFRKD